VTSAHVTSRTRAGITRSHGSFSSWLTCDIAPLQDVYKLVGLDLNIGLYIIEGLLRLDT
jgi:hypothetical protein